METVGVSRGEMLVTSLVWMFYELQTSRELKIFKNENKRIKQHQSDWSEVRLTGSSCKARLIT